MTEHDWHLRAMRAEDRAEAAEAEVERLRAELTNEQHVRHTATTEAHRHSGENVELRIEVQRLRALLDRINALDRNDHRISVGDAIDIALEAK